MSHSPRQLMTVLLASSVLLSMGLFTLDAPSYSDTKAAPSATTIQAEVIKNKSLSPAVVAKMNNVDYTRVNPMDLVKSPAGFKDKYVSFETTFNSFSNLGLDYPKADRSSSEYISVIVLRPDVPEHHIPMSEIKLFFPRKDSDSVLELELGDKINVKGHVFSVAMNDPWVDITEIKVIEKAHSKKTDKTK